jgi:phosphonate transport system substrate-binding protein
MSGVYTERRRTAVAMSRGLATVRLSLSRRPLLLLCLLAAACGDQAGPRPEAPDAATKRREVVRLTGIPDENPTLLVRRNEPLVNYLSEELGAQVEFAAVTDYGAAVQALSSGQVDFAWLGGFTFVQARRLAGAVPLVMREIDRKFQSVFIASVESEITKPADLVGRTFAFGSKSSTSGHLMPRHFLESVHGIDPDTDFDGRPIYTGAHDATAKAVESGRVDAGALNILVWRRMLDEGKLDPTAIRVIWLTPPYVDYVWAARPGVPERRQRRFAKAFLSLDASKVSDGEVLALQDAEGFVLAREDDFDAIERVGLSTGLLRD